MVQYLIIEDIRREKVNMLYNSIRDRESDTNCAILHQDQILEPEAAQGYYFNLEGRRGGGVSLGAIGYIKMLL